MIVFIYDQSFEGWLTVVFEAFRLRKFPESLLGPEDPPPLLAREVVTVTTDPEKAGRVWAGLGRRLSRLALKQVMSVWLTGEPAGAELMTRYVRFVFSGTGETDFAHPDVLALKQLAQKVGQETERIRQFVRFQKTAEGVFFAAVAPLYNVLPLTLSHFSTRFADQKWALYDLNREYGFFYDLKTVAELNARQPVNRASGRLAESELAEDEGLWREAWQTYFQAVAIPQRANPRLQRQFMPKRFWPFLTEMQLD